jgi:ribosomal protein L37AE/L43A
MEVEEFKAKYESQWLDEYYDKLKVNWKEVVNEYKDYITKELSDLKDWDFDDEDESPSFYFSFNWSDMGWTVHSVDWQFAHGFTEDLGMLGIVVGKDTTYENLIEEYDDDAISQFLPEAIKKNFMKILGKIDHEYKIPYCLDCGANTFEPSNYASGFIWKCVSCGKEVSYLCYKPETERAIFAKHMNNQEIYEYVLSHGYVVVVADWDDGTIQPIMVDIQTANGLKVLHEGLNERNKEKFLTMDFLVLVDFAKDHVKSGNQR